MSCIVYQTNKKTGITYAYESISYWDKEKQQPRSKRQYIGRVDDKTGEIIPKQDKKNRTAGAAASQKDNENLLQQLEEKNLQIANLSAENDRLKAELFNANQTLTKIKRLCEDLV